MQDSNYINTQKGNQGNMDSWVEQDTAQLNHRIKTKEPKLKAKHEDCQLSEKNRK